MVCDGSDRAECEGLMDIIFDNYCLSITSVADPESTSTTTSNSITTTFSLPFPSPKPIMNSGACENSSRTSPILTFSMKCQSNIETNHSQTHAVIVFGTLFSISVVLLAVMIAGWVCTAYCMHKKYSQAKKIPQAPSLAR